MERFEINSSNLKSIGWKEIENKLGDLEVEFNNGKIYTYFLVPQALFEDLLGAESKGKFFNEKIIKGKYKFKLNEQN